MIRTLLGRGRTRLGLLEHDNPRAEALDVRWDEIGDRVKEFLALAAEDPSPTYYQIAADLLVRKHRSEEAIEGL